MTDEIINTETQEQPHKRRVRYSGKYPKKFNEKYKELNPERYGDTVAHVIAKGNTPAGTHIPIMVQEILDVLDIKPGEQGFDGTLGYGGHTRAMLDKLQGEGHIIGEYDNIGANPRKVEWGSAPILLQSTNTPGKITVVAKSWKDGATYALTPDTITIESVAPALKSVYKETPSPKKRASSAASAVKAEKMSEAERQKLLDEVNKQQMEFGIN